MAALLNNAHASKMRAGVTQGRVTVRVVINNDQDPFLCLDVMWFIICASTFSLLQLSLSNGARVCDDIQSIAMIRHDNTTWRLQIIQFLWVLYVKSVFREETQDNTFNMFAISAAHVWPRKRKTKGLIKTVTQYE